MRVEVFRFFWVSTLLRAFRMSSSFNFFDIANSIKASPVDGRHCGGIWDKMESARSRLFASNKGPRQHVNSARPTRNKKGIPKPPAVVRLIGLYMARYTPSNKNTSQTRK